MKKKHPGGDTLPEITVFALEKWMVEMMKFLFGWLPFSGAMLVSGGVEYCTMPFFQFAYGDSPTRYFVRDDSSKHA